LVDSEFEEFWAAYPKRTGPNPKTKAREKYDQMRRAKVSHETLMAGVNKLAKSRENEDPTFTPQAATWLNQRRWEDDCEDVPMVDVTSAAKVAAEMYDELAEDYPGVVDHEAAKKEAFHLIRTGIANPLELTTALQKFCKLEKQRREVGSFMPIPLFSQWLKFRWREMDAYEFCRSGMSNKLAVRPKRKG
jgi:hypothetical protein